MISVDGNSMIELYTPYMIVFSSDIQQVDSVDYSDSCMVVRNFNEIRIGTGPRWLHTHMYILTHRSIYAVI
jgi:hypothetical protein